MAINPLIVAGTIAQGLSGAPKKGPENLHSAVPAPIIETTHLIAHEAEGVLSSQVESGFRDKEAIKVVQASNGSYQVVAAEIDPEKGGYINNKDTKVKPLGEVGPEHTMFPLLEKELPPVAELIGAHPEIEPEVVTKFVEDFDLLGRSKGRLTPGFYSLRPSERSLMFQIYASTFDTLGQNEGARKKIIKYSVGIPDVRENVMYIIENEGDIRGDDPIDIVSKVQRARKNFPEVDKILTLEFLEEIETLQHNALAAIQQRRKNLQEGLEESIRRGKELDKRSKELDRNINFLQELRNTLFPTTALLVE